MNYQQHTKRLSSADLSVRKFADTRQRLLALDALANVDVERRFGRKVAIALHRSLSTFSDACVGASRVEQRKRFLASEGVHDTETFLHWKRRYEIREMLLMLGALN